MLKTIVTEHAILSENLEMVTFLVNIYRADIHQKDENGNSCLHLAIKTQNFKIAEFLIQEGAKVNTKNNRGTTPLHVATFTNNLSITKLLTDHKATNRTEESSGIDCFAMTALFEKRVEIPLLLACSEGLQKSGTTTKSYTLDNFIKVAQSIKEETTDLPTSSVKTARDMQKRPGWS